jgi:hypothetical protein
MPYGPTGPWGASKFQVCRIKVTHSKLVVPKFALGNNDINNNDLYRLQQYIKLEAMTLCIKKVW